MVDDCSDARHSNMRQQEKCQLMLHNGTNYNVDNGSSISKTSYQTLHLWNRQQTTCIIHKNNLIWVPFSSRTNKKEEKKKLHSISPEILDENSGPQMFMFRKMLARNFIPNVMPTCPSFGNLFLMNRKRVRDLFYAYKHWTGVRFAHLKLECFYDHWIGI